MKRIVTISLLLLSFLSLSVNAQYRWLNDFEGTVGTAKIGLTLASTETGEFPRGNDIECNYFYVTQLKDIKMKCSIDIAGNFIFKELDERGNVRATFRGAFYKNKTDVAEGTWTRTGAVRSLPFRMIHEQSVSSKNGNRYSHMDVTDPVKFENQVRDFKTAVAKGDKQKVAAQIRYPINVMVNGKKIRVKNKAALLQYYDRVFDKEFVETLQKTVPHNMFTRDIGAMLGHGILWFRGDGKVIAINN